MPWQTRLPDENESRVGDPYGARVGATTNRIKRLWSVRFHEAKFLARKTNRPLRERGTC